jgi:Tfp pilus assembly PilM family ATPase
MKTSLIERIFPTPSYVRMNSVGFDISDRSMKFAELTLGKGGLVLARYGETPIPDGFEFRKIEKPAEFKNFLLEFKKIHKFDRVRISLPEEQMYLYTLSMDAVSPKELHNALELSLEEHIPIKASEVVFDYTVLSEKKGRYRSRGYCSAREFCRKLP